ncbi:sensor histidine kinase [Kineosporia babensis]|uniref:histidine kinase n=1 Tax=Kineosporia babensis TaxID=499548 RepID=A0A9X1SU02_9ACTN|nr:histidine kinase [Kineosporia babensis]MCD5311876.1 histidine kinase [Kineosporia babensis]
MIRQDLALLLSNALTGLRVLLIVAARDRNAVVQNVIARQHRNDSRALGPGDPAGLRTPVTVSTTWLIAQAVLGPGLLALSLLLWGGALGTVAIPLWWNFASETPLPGLRVEVGSTRNSFVLAGLGLVFVVIAAACSHGLPRWHARVNEMLSSAGRSARLERRVAALTQSRSGALEAQATELRRIERDLHDGAQARLVALTMTLGVLDRRLRDAPASTRQLLGSARGEVEEALRELRELVRNVYPPILADRGLAGGLESLAEQVTYDLQMDVVVQQRLPVPLESTVYFVVAEALTNISRHSNAAHASVEVRSDGQQVTIKVVDDGRGGADETQGSGLTGLRRRVAAFDGTMTLSSPPGGPTHLSVEIPCA